MRFLTSAEDCTFGGSSIFISNRSEEVRGGKKQLVRGIYDAYHRKLYKGKCAFLSQRLYTDRRATRGSHLFSRHLMTARATIAQVRLSDESVDLK